MDYTNNPEPEFGKADPDKVYRDRGYRNRAKYLKEMAIEYGVPLATVHAIAHMLGPNEDFDGLTSALEDH